MKKTIYLILGLSICLSFFSCEKKLTNDDYSPGEQQLKQGLLAYYPFNGSASDEGGNGYDLSVNGAVMIDNRFGERQKAYKFNGISDFMIIPKILKADSLTELTLSVWVNPENLSHSSILSFLSNDPPICSCYLGFDKNGTAYSTWHQMITEIRPGNCIASIIRDTIGNPLDKWSHIVLIQRYHIENTFPRYEYNQYYNGKKLKTEASTYGWAITATSFSQGGIIGGNNTRGDYNYNFDFFKGGIDDIRIYDRALSDDEVTQLYNLRE